MESHSKKYVLLFFFDQKEKEIEDRPSTFIRYSPYVIRILLARMS